MDPGLRFWLRYVDHRGGLAEPTADGTVVMLPPAVAGEFDLPEELIATDDPDVARDDGTVLLATGHPALIRAADAALTDGDVGVITLAAPDGPPPGPEQLQDRLREHITVEHGKIDVSGLPARVDRPVLRVGALITYSVSADETYQERLECWVDAASEVRLGSDAVSRLQRAPRSDRPARVTPALVRSACLGGDAPGLGQAHHVLETSAERRRAALSAQASEAHRRELGHARTYYDDALRSLKRRRDAADPERAELLAAREISTREERDRRLAEIDEKYRPRHDIRPFRLHLLQVPGWRVPVEIRRGPRPYPFSFDWLPTLGGFATERCPHCRAVETLSAGKTRLGCRSCQPGGSLHAVG